MKKHRFLFFILLLSSLIFAEEIKREDYGTIFKTTVNDNRVNVRDMPSRGSKVVGQKNKGDVVYVTGFSVEKETIDNYEGYWVRISLAKNESWSDSGGWIFSKYINVDRSLNVSEITVAKVNPATSRSLLNIALNVKRNNVIKEVAVLPRSLNNGKFYTFTWSDDERDFWYGDPVGTFIWYPETNEIKHISYLGYGMESAWCLVTDDFKYLLQDYGTGPGPRALGIYDMETNASLFSGSYYRDLEYDGKSVIVVQVLESWDTEHSDIDAQSVQYATEFKKNTPMTEEQIKWKNSSGDVAVIVRYRLELSTMKKEYIDCQYITTQ